MNKVQKQRMTIAITALVGISLAVGFLLYALRSNLNHFYTPSELVQGQAFDGQGIRVGGLVKDGSVKRSDENSLAVEFKVTDSAEDIVVYFEGILPDLFREGQGIVVTGRFEGNRVLADEVLAKHDETYMPPEAMEAMKKAGHPGS
jgi:cytochrome c-type biogenesis protein CcmE